MSKFHREDLKAGFLVFLIALPLCLGIAMASGFPPVAGVLTAIIGGVLVSHLGSAPLTIKGPAAGLIVIALGAVQELGQGDAVLGYKRALAVGAVAAAIQVLFALVRVATVGVAMSKSVVHGMLAAIGIIIISKQAHTALGVSPHAKEPLELIAEIPSSIWHPNAAILVIGVVSLLILFGMPLLKHRWAKLIPAPMVVLAVAVPLGLIFGLDHEHNLNIWASTVHVGPEFLVQLPGSLLDAIAFPDFSVVFTPASLKYIVMFALVGTIESTLSVIAVDALDPQKRSSDLNKDLLAAGLGNLLCAMVGGLPMISEIVRSKANIDSGARSTGANFFHGLFLLAFVALAPGILQNIPLAALAAMLVYTGYRLAAPREFVHAWHLGLDQLALFLVTLVVTLATDLLIGVAAGLVLKVALHVARGASIRTLFSSRVELSEEGGDTVLRVHGAAAFSSIIPVRRALSRLPQGVHAVVVDLSKAVLVDHTFLSAVEAMADELPENTEFRFAGLEDGFKAASPHPHASRKRIAA